MNRSAAYRNRGRGRTRRGIPAGRRLVGRDHGSATVLTAALALVLVTCAATAMIIVDVVLAAHRARGAADLAALAAAGARLAGVDPCGAARVNARDNGAVLSGCQVSGHASSFVVTVSVAVSTGLTNPLPATASALARAGNVRSE